jgi:hypothetical protein
MFLVPFESLVLIEIQSEDLPANDFEKNHGNERAEGLWKFHADFEALKGELKASLGCFSCFFYTLPTYSFVSLV